MPEGPIETPASAQVEASGLWLGIVRATGRLCLRLPRTVWFAAAVGWAGMIWLLSGSEGTQEPGSLFWNWLHNLAHAPLFGLLALWMALAGPRVWAGSPWARLGALDRRVVLWAIVAFALIDEWHQSSVAGRTASLFDLVTDCLAAFLTLRVATLAGEPGTTEAALRKLLVQAVVLCCLAALLATSGY